MAGKPDSSEAKAVRRIRRFRGAFRTSQALSAGIQPRTLYAMRDAGTLDQLSRGVFRLANLTQPADPDMLVIAARLPMGVICLLSALSFHGLTEEIPHAIHVALPRGAGEPRLEHPPLQIVRLRQASFRAGIESHPIDGLQLRVYSPAKTVADCFQFRSRVGMETTLAALKALRRTRGFDPEQLLRFARICRVENLVRPYLEAIL